MNGELNELIFFKYLLAKQMSIQCFIKTHSFKTKAM